MPGQEFVVLQCLKCSTFQVQMQRKATKWLCKLCNHKQSVKQFFGSGSAKLCRLTVQTLNTQRATGLLSGADTGRQHTGILSAMQAMDISTGCEGTGADTVDADSRILDFLMANDENSESNDEVSFPKKQKLSESSDESEYNETIGGKRQPIVSNNSNQLFKRSVSQWDQFLSKQSV